MWKKRVCALMLCAGMLSGSLFTLLSCTEKNQSNEGDQTNASGEKAYLDNLPETMDFGGATITFAFTEGDDGSFTERSLHADEDSTDSVDIAVYNRNKMVEERLNVKLETVKMPGACKEYCLTSLLGGSPDYDVICGYQYADLPMALESVLINYHKLSDFGADYIDLNQPYWAFNYIDNITYKDKLYWITGDLSLRYMGGMFCTYVNARLYDIYCKETYGDIYELVKNGKWDMDTMNAMATSAYADQNSSESPDAEDQLGYVTVRTDVLYSMAISAGVQWSTVNPDGSVSLTISNPSTYTYAEKLNSLLSGGYSYIAPSYPDALTLFAGGNVLFTNNKVHQASVRFTEMNDDYYIIPCPKLDQNQSNYITYIHNGCTIFGISSCSDVIPAAAASLEALCAESSRTVRPAFYDSALKWRYTRDANAAEMIDLMRDSVRSDFALAWTTSVGNVAEIFHHNTPSSLASSIKRQSKAWTSTLTKLQIRLEELE